MQRSVSIYDFSFHFCGRGHYKVTFTSRVTGKFWTKLTNNMPLIDATKNSAYPKIKDLNDLKYLCKH